jgi:hypothetical protein
LPDGRISGKYTVSAPNSGLDTLLSKTTFTYNSSQRLTEWSVDYSNLYAGLTNTYSIVWSSGNATYVDGTGGSPLSPLMSNITGSYTYDPSKPGQPAHPLSIYALYEWGQPLIQCNDGMVAHNLAPGYPVIQNISWSGNRISSYVIPGPAGGTRTSFTYY